MTQSERRTRGDTERDGPDRRPETVDKVISKAVQAAYQVAQENIRQGRRAAQTLRAGNFQPSDVSESTKIVAERMVQLTKDLSAAWIEMVAAILIDPELRAVFSRKPQDSAPQKPADTTYTAPALVTYQVSSHRPTEVTLSPLMALTDPTTPTVAGLLPHAHAQQDAPPIHDVRFTRGPDGGLRVNIRIAENHPPGHYVGAVVDQDSHQPIGTLWVRILE